MTTTYKAARNTIQSLFWTAWQANAPALTGGSVPEVRWQGKEEPSLPPSDASWARVTVRHTGGQQATLGGPSLRRWRREGLITIQVFTPISDGEGLNLGLDLAKIAADAYEGQDGDGGIWFRNVRVSEIGPDGPWFQHNMLAAFEYDELR